MSNLKDNDLKWLMEQAHNDYLTWIALWLACLLGITNVLTAVVRANGILATLSQEIFIHVMYWGLVSGMIFSVHRLVIIIRNGIFWANRIQDQTLRREALSTRMRGFGSRFVVNDRGRVCRANRFLVYLAHVGLFYTLLLLASNVSRPIEHSITAALLTLILLLAAFRDSQKTSGSSGRTPSKKSEVGSSFSKSGKASVLLFIFIIALLATSAYYFAKYLFAPEYHIGIEDWQNVDEVALSIQLTDISRKGFDGFTNSMDVSIFLLSPNHGLLDMTVPISDISALANRNFSFWSNSIDWRYSTVSLVGTGMHNQTRISLNVDSSDSYERSFQIPENITIGNTLRLTGSLRPFNISKSLIQLFFFMQLNQSRFNITESFFPPPELQLSHAPFLEPKGILQTSNLGVSIERIASMTSSTYFLRMSDMNIEMKHFEQNISLVLGGLFLTSSISLAAVFRSAPKRLVET